MRTAKEVNLPDEINRWAGVRVSTADGQVLGTVRGSLWSDDSGTELLGVVGAHGGFVVAADPTESPIGISVDRTFSFIAEGPSAGEIGRLVTTAGLQAAVSRLSEYYEVAFAAPPGPPTHDTPPPEWLRRVIEADPVPWSEPVQDES